MAYGRDFAAVYNEHWRFFSQKAGPLVLDWISKDDLGSPRRVLDLCCGTGVSSEPFAVAGWEVTGVDLAPEMVDLANERARQLGVAQRVHYQVGDVAVLSLEAAESFDLVISFYDSLNHLPSIDALLETFRRAATYSRPGTKFVFDLNTTSGLQSWAQTQVIDEDGRTLILRGAYDSTTEVASLNVVGYVRNGDNAYRRFEDLAVERAFDLNEVLTCLKQSGWGSVRITTYEDLDTWHPDPETLPRATFVAERR